MNQEKARQESEVTSQSFGNKKVILFSAILGIAAIAIIAGVFVIANLNSGSIGKLDQFSSSSGLEEIDLALKDGVSSVLSSIDFTKLDSDRPISFIDIDRISKETKRILNRFVYLSVPVSNENVPKPGFKNHSAFDLSFATEVDSGRSKIDLKLDVYQEYTDEYDYELQKRILDQSVNVSAADGNGFLSYIKDNFMNVDNIKTLFKGQNLLIEGELVAADSQGELNMQFDLLTIGNRGYFVLKSVNAEGGGFSDFEQLAGIQGKYFSIDMAEVIMVFFEQVWPQLDSNPAFSQSFNTNTQNLSDSFEQFNSLLAYIDKNQIDAIQRTGDPIKNVISNSVNKLKLFPDIKEVDPIRLTQNKCVSGNVDIKNLIVVLGDGYKEIMKIILNDSSTTISQAEKDKAMEDIEMQLRMLPLLADFVNLGVRTCSDIQKGLAGGGLSLNINLPGNNFAVSFDALNVENGFDKVIQAPADAEDATNQIIETIKIEEMMNNTNF